MCRQLHCQNNLKFNTLSLIMSIGVVQSPWEGLGKEYDGSLFKFANSSDLWGAKGNGRSVFRNYSMLHEWCGNVHVYVSLKILEWVYGELPELSGEVRLKNSLRQFTELVWLKTFLTFRLFDLSDVSYARIVLHEDFDSYLSKLWINVITLH